MEEENKEEDLEEEMSVEDIAENNEAVLNALINLLVEKNIITEEELDKKIEEMNEYEEDGEE